MLKNGVHKFSEVIVMSLICLFCLTDGLKCWCSIKLSNMKMNNVKCGKMTKWTDRLLSSVQVKKTTQPWFGSGFMRARPSAARPVVPTTNWCTMSSPTNSYIPPVIPDICHTAVRLHSVSFSMKYSFRTSWRRIRPPCLSFQSPGRLFITGSVYFLVLA